MSGLLFSETKLFRIPQYSDIQYFPDGFNGLLVVLPAAADPAERQLLDTILTAGLKLLPEATAVSEGAQLNMGQIKRSGVKQILALGASECLPSLNINWPLNEVVHVLGIPVLCSQSLSQLQTNSQAKKALWSALKRGFLDLPKAE
ncbi:MAG: hypothetical protein U0T84_00730 [Chitinophagales bacterium]